MGEAEMEESPAEVGYEQEPIRDRDRCAVTSAADGRDPASFVELDFIVRHLEALVRIPSVNPDLVPGAGGETEIARHLVQVCQGLGLRAQVEMAAPGRPNVIAVLPGAAPARGRSLMLNGHTDTVGGAGMEAPFEPRREGDRLYGRGSNDMKAGLVAMLAAVAAVRTSGVRPLGDVMLTFVADEEYLSVGTEAVARAYRADAAIVTESSRLHLRIAHKGFVWAKIRTEGRAAHGSDFRAGIDAILHMGRVLTAIERLEQAVLPRREHPLLGRASVHAALIEGGEGLSTYPPSCTLQIERRTLPGETDATVRAELEEILTQLSRQDAAFRGTVELIGAREPLEVDQNAEIVRAVDAAAETVLGARPEHVGGAGWTDAALLAAAGIPTVIYGPSGAGGHSAVEYVEIPSVVDCAKVLAHTIATFCGAATDSRREG
jgi:acetylornithine deacetylase